jgi:hypothetical protein
VISNHAPLSQLPTQARRTVTTFELAKHRLDLNTQQPIVTFTAGTFTTFEPAVVTALVNFQDAAHHPHRPTVSMFVDKAILQRGALAKYPMAFFINSATIYWNLFLA